MEVIEPAAITKYNEYFRTEEYQKLEKGEKYILFLSDDNITKQLSVISANNGKVNISDLEDNEYVDIRDEVVDEFVPLEILENLDER